MTHDELRYIVLVTRDGGFYHVTISDYPKLEYFTREEMASVEWLELEAASDKGKILLRFTEIQSFYISSPESRKAHLEFARLIESESNDEPEPWKKN